MSEIEGLRPPQIPLEWEVIYKDGEILLQSYGQDEEHHFGDIDEDRVNQFRLVTQDDRVFAYIIPDEKIINIGGMIYHIQFPPGKKEVGPRIVFYRRTAVTTLRDGTIQYEIKYLVGLQSTIDGKNYKQIIIINPNNTLTLTTHR